MKSPIIENPSLQTLRQRFTSSFLTFLFWVFWIYLWLPLVSLLAWGVGVDLFYQELIAESGYKTILKMMFWYIIAISTTAVIFIAWAVYNLFRFRKKDRRKEAKVVGTIDLAHYFKIDERQVKKFQKSKYLVIHHDEEGNIKSIENQNPNLKITRIA